MDLESLLRVHINGLDKTKSDYRQRSIELCHLGKLLLSIEPSYEITEVREAPDFIVKNGSIELGIEHTTINEPEKREFEGSVHDLFYKAQEKFKILYPDKQQLVNIFFRRDIPLSKKKRPEVIDEINRVINHWIDNKKLLKNDFIERLFSMNHSELDFEPNIGAWGSGTLSLDILNECITAKNGKVKNYIENTGLRQQWLFIVIGSMGKSSYASLEQLGEVVTSDFERIYLLEDFKTIITQIK